MLRTQWVLTAEICLVETREGSFSFIHETVELEPSQLDYLNFSFGDFVSKLAHHLFIGPLISRDTWRESGERHNEKESRSSAVNPENEQLKLTARALRWCYNWLKDSPSPKHDTRNPDFPRFLFKKKETEKEILIS